MNKADLLALAARVEAASDNAIIREVVIALDRAEPLAFTAVGAFLDAAASLVPEGWGWEIYSDGLTILRREIEHKASKAATPALALTAAALRAMAEGAGE